MNKFKYEMDQISATDAKIITMNLHNYQWNQTYIASTIMQEFKPKLLINIIDKLNPLNAGFIMSSPSFTNLTEYDSLYDFHYKITEKWFSK